MIISFFRLMGKQEAASARPPVFAIIRLKGNAFRKRFDAILPVRMSIAGLQSQ
jgi:hypothetical protein